MKNSLAYFVWLASSVMLLSGCEGLPIKNDTSEPSALQQLKSNNPNGINIITEENKAIYDKKLRTYIAKEYGRVEIALIQGELNKIYQSFFEKMNVTVGYMPKVIVRISGLNQIYLAENGDVVIDYSLLKQLDKPDLIASLLANSAALVAVGYGDFKQAQKVLDVATMLLGTKSQINTSTVGSIQDKLTSMAIDELTSGVEQSLLKKSDAIALELLAESGYELNILIDKLPGSPNVPQQINPESTDLMAQAKKLMNGLKESAIGATETRFDAVKPLVVKLSELKSASSPKVNDSYVQALQSANTQNAFKYLDSLFELNTRGKLSRSEIEKLTVIPEKTEASLRCPTVALNSMTLFQFSSKDKAFALVDKYQEECMGQSMFTNAFSIASAEKQGDYIKAYQRAVKADELYDTPDFLIERVRLAKKSSTLDMASIRCTLEWGLHSIDKKPIERLCTEAESGSPGKWYQQFLR